MYTQVFSVEFLDTELTAYTTSLKAAGKGAAGAGPAGAGGDGEGQAAEDAAVGPSKGALASPPVRAQNKVCGLHIALCIRHASAA